MSAPSVTTGQARVAREGRRAWTAKTKIGWSLLVLGAVLMVLFGAGKYYTFDSSVYFDVQRKVYENHTFWLMLHISGMVFAVLLGPWQFYRRLRERHFRLHRTLGKIYIAGATVGAIGGIYMSQWSAYGAVSHLAFLFLGIGVLVTTTTAFLRIRRGNVQSHREWMTRSYALIFAAVTLRIYLPILRPALGQHTAYLIISWACWVPNLVFAEWLIRTKLRPHPEMPRMEQVEAAPMVSHAT